MTKTKLTRTTKRTRLTRTKTRTKTSAKTRRTTPRNATDRPTDPTTRTTVAARPRPRRRPPTTTKPPRFDVDSRDGVRSATTVAARRPSPPPKPPRRPHRRPPRATAPRPRVHPVDPSRPRENLRVDRVPLRRARARRRRSRNAALWRSPRVAVASHRAAATTARATAARIVAARLEGVARRALASAEADPEEEDDSSGAASKSSDDSSGAASKSSDPSKRRDHSLRLTRDEVDAWTPVTASLASVASDVTRPALAARPPRDFRRGARGSSVRHEPGVARENIPGRVRRALGLDRRAARRDVPQKSRAQTHASARLPRARGAARGGARVPARGGRPEVEFDGRVVGSGTRTSAHGGGESVRAAPGRRARGRHRRAVREGASPRARREPRAERGNPRRCVASRGARAPSSRRPGTPSPNPASACAANFASTSNDNPSRTSPETQTRPNRRR